MEEGSPLLTHVNERGLHSGQDSGNLAKHDVSNRGLVSLTFDVEFCDDAGFYKSNARFSQVNVYDNDISGHALDQAADRTDFVPVALALEPMKNLRKG